MVGLELRAISTACDKDKLSEASAETAMKAQRIVTTNPANGYLMVICIPRNIGLIVPGGRIRVALLPTNTGNQQKARLVELYRGLGGLENARWTIMGNIGVTVERITMMIEIKADCICVAYHGVRTGVAALVAAAIAMAVRRYHAADKQQ